MTHSGRVLRNPGSGAAASIKSLRWALLLLLLRMLLALQRQQQQWGAAEVAALSEP